MNLLSALRMATACKIGLVIETPQVQKLKAKAYALKRKNPELSYLSFLTSRTNPDGEIWILNAQAADNPAGAEGAPDPDEVV